LLPNASIFRRHWNPFHVERSLLVDAICTMRLATPQYGQSDCDQFNVLYSDRIVCIHGLRPVLEKCQRKPSEIGVGYQWKHTLVNREETGVRSPGIG
jgi:hypothetical protein